MALRRERAGEACLREDSTMPESESRRRLRELVRPLSAEEEDDCGGRLRLGLQMMEAGIDMMRANLARRYPTESRQALEVRLKDWLYAQPVASHLIPRQLSI